MGFDGWLVVVVAVAGMRYLVTEKRTYPVTYLDALVARRFLGWGVAFDDEEEEESTKGGSTSRGSTDGSLSLSLGGCRWVGRESVCIYAYR